MAWRGVGGSRHHGMVQDRFPAFRNGDQDSSEVILFNLYIRLPLGDDSRSVEEAGDHALFHMAWVVREVQISVRVGGLSVDAYVKGSIVLAVEECVQEWQLANHFLLHSESDSRTSLS